MEALAVAIQSRELALLEGPTKAELLAFVRGGLGAYLGARGGAASLGDRIRTVIAWIRDTIG
jgi:hypothetical protein